MNFICDHLKNLKKPYNEDDFYIKINEFGIEMDMKIARLRKILNKNMKKSIRNVKIYYDNICLTNKPIISFKYNDLYCEISEYFDIDYDYLCLSIQLLE